MNIPATLEEAIAQIAGLTKERNALLSKHRSVCVACKMLDSNPSTVLKDFLEANRPPPHGKHT